MKRILFLLLVCVVFFYFLNRTSFGVSFRKAGENMLVIPIRQLFFKNLKTKIPTETQKLRILSLEQQVERLKKENKLLRTQLGAIPEKSSLYPVTLIWDSDTELFLNFSYEKSANDSLRGKPIIIDDVFMGRIKRAQGHVLVAEKPTNTGFKAPGRTNKGVKGTIKGQFNEQLLLEVDQKVEVKKGDIVYLVDNENGWQFMLGKVTIVKRNERLPVKNAYVDYIPHKGIQADTLFIVL